MNWSSLLKISVFLLLVSTAFSQEHVIWFKADPSVFNSPEWIELSKEFRLSTPSQALSFSRNPELKKVYEVQGSCDLRTFKHACSVFGNNVYSIERGPTYTPLFVPNDMNAQPGISDYALSLINAPQAWNLTQGDDSVVIAISDQNFEVVHQDLEGKYIHYDAGNTAPTTHGTAVAITAAGKTNNGYGLSSIGFNTSLALYKMNFNEILAASYAGADVINISWTSGCFYSQLEQDVMDEVSANGSFIVAAAGNGNTCGLPDALVYPASYNHVFSVTSVGPSDNHEQWIGDPSSTHNHNDSVDLAAPGYDVAVSPASGWYLNINGTSFAAAYVSGTVALMLSANKCISNLQIEQILKNTSAPLNSLNPAYAGKLGAGRLDAFQAVLAASTTWNPITPSFLIADSCLAHDASATLLIQGAQAPFEVVWGNNVIGVVNPNLNTNTYTVHIEGTHGCRLDTSVFVHDVIPPTYTVIQVDPMCADSYNGGIQLNLTNNTTTSFLWSEGTSGNQLSGIGAGVYNAVLTYGNGCAIQQSFTLTAPPAIIATALISNETAPNNGGIDLTVTGGVAPYSFLWDNNQTLEDLSALHAGTYQLQITDANGCQVGDSFQVANLLSTGSLNESESMVEIYPNPNNGSFHITIPIDEVHQLTIFDMQGRLISTERITSSTWLSTQLPTGKYVAVFNAPQKQTMIPFIVY
ncbi:MAG: hypothetical protein RLZZ198_2260 [Bacteroidota bacterium]|jgi:hypothetical protein